MLIKLHVEVFLLFCYAKYSGIKYEQQEINSLKHTSLISIEIFATLSKNNKLFIEDHSRKVIYWLLMTSLSVMYQRVG